MYHTMYVNMRIHLHYAFNPALHQLKEAMSLGVMRDDFVDFLHEISGAEVIFFTRSCGGASHLAVSQNLSPENSKLTKASAVILSLSSFFQHSPSANLTVL